MANELVRFDSGEFEVMQRMAKAMVASGYFNDVKDVAQGLVKIQAGAEMGLPPFASMTGIHVIKGKPVLGANLIATLIKNDARYDYHVDELTDEVCRISFYENGRKVGDSSFTLKEARKAGVGATTPPGKPASMLEMFPRNMLFSRAISNGVKWYTPGVFGGSPVYTPDELGADMDEEGDPIIDVTPKKVNKETGEIVEGETAEWEEVEPAKQQPAPKVDPVAQARANAKKSVKLFLPAVMQVTGWNDGDVKAAAKKLGMGAASGKQAERVKQFDTLVEFAGLVEDGLPEQLAVGVLNGILSKEEAEAEVVALAVEEEE